jgi:urease accessory protein
MDSGQLAALLQLSSPALPIGGYSYSQGFEAAVELNIVHDEASAYAWISQQLKLVVAQCEAPVWILLFHNWSRQDWAGVTHWNNWFHTSRETQELRQETEQMGWSLAKLAADLNWGDAHARSYLLEHQSITFPTAHTFSACTLGISQLNGLTAYLFAWLENQVMAAIKTIPLGQMAGQRILNEARQLIPAVINEAQARALHEPPRVYSLAPQFAILSSRHETQYSRLFRS